MGVTRHIVLAAALVFCLRGLAPAASAPELKDSAHQAAVIRLSGEVDDYSRDMLFRRFHQAQAQGAKVVILEIDTYGGLVTSGMDISRFLRGQNGVHTIAFVDNKAISAGAMIAMACNEIVMTPGAVLGDCAPIVLDRTGSMTPLPAAERAKIQSPILEDFEESARRNGYSVAVADAMVKVESSVYLQRDADGHERAINASEHEKLKADHQWLPAPGVKVPVDGPDTLLTVGPETAARLGLSKATVNSAQALAAQRGYSIVADLTPSVGDHLVEAINGPWARFILLVVFLLSLYISLHAPGHGAAEAVAILSLGLLVVIPLMTGYAQWWEIGLICIGLAMCAFEVFVFPGHGFSLGLGLLLMFAGFVFTFVGKEPGQGWMPLSDASWHAIGHGILAVVGAMITTLVAALILQRWLPAMPMFKRFILTETSPARPPTAAGSPTKAGEDVWPFVGTHGIAHSDLRPGGLVQFPYGSDARTASVVSVSGFVPAGSKVVVQEARGNRIVVRVV